MQQGMISVPLPVSSRRAERLVSIEFSDIALGLLGPIRVGRLFDEGQMASGMSSIIKRNNCREALEAARLARDMHGGNDIQEIDQVMRHALILGRAQTGLRAFY